MVKRKSVSLLFCHTTYIKRKFSYLMQLYFKASYIQCLFLNICITKMTSIFVCMLLYFGTLYLELVEAGVRPGLMVKLF